MKKENNKDLSKTQAIAKTQLLNYVKKDKELKDLKNLQAWTVVVVKDKVNRKRVH